MPTTLDRSGMVFPIAVMAEPPPRPAAVPRAPSWPALAGSRPSTGPAAAPPEAALSREPPGVPLLTFDEDELAALAARAAAVWSRKARAEAGQALEARRAEALQRTASALVAAAQARRETDERFHSRLVRVAEAIAGAYAWQAAEAGPDRVAQAMRSVLRTLPDPTAVRLVVETDAAEPLRARLPDIARSAGFAGSLEIEADPRLGPGAVQLLWPGGWAEHAPARIEEQVAAILAAHRPPTATANNPTSEESSHDPHR
jgi:flagellar biosynthesis/type III secretory pathway protein FliH